MGGQTKQQPTQTTETQLSPQQNELFDLAMPGVRQFAANVPKRYGGTTIAGFNPSQVAGQEDVLRSAGTMRDLAESGAKSTQSLLGSIWDPKFNPNLQGAIDASVRPITQNLTEQQLPSIRGGSVMTGNFGGSRQGIAEGLASGRASQAIGDTASRVAQNEYETNINAQLKALGLLPSIQQAQLAPGLATSGVGDVRQAMDQARLSEGVNNFNYDQVAPFLQAKELLSLVQGIPGGKTVAQGNVPQANPWTQALGGAAGGATLGATVGGPFGAVAGGGIGALLPFLLNR